MKTTHQHITNRKQPKAKSSTFFSPSIIQAKPLKKNAKISRTDHKLQKEGIQVRSPALEETAVLISDINAAVEGKALSSSHIKLARPIFKNSLDYNKVRLVYSSFLEYRTIGNTIRVPKSFTLTNPDMAQTFIHELTHVWQYQHQGTSYISNSLQHQISAHLKKGNRNFAYDYTIRSGMSFFDFNPEQQASIVENYYAMLRDQKTSCGLPKGVSCISNHLDPATGFRKRLSQKERKEEINRELPLYLPLIKQVQSAIPLTDFQRIQVRSRDLMQAPDPFFGYQNPDQQMLPLNPVLEIKFDWLGGK